MFETERKMFEEYSGESFFSPSGREPLMKIWRYTPKYGGNWREEIHLIKGFNAPFNWYVFITDLNCQNIVALEYIFDNSDEIWTMPEMVSHVRDYLKVYSKEI